MSLKTTPREEAAMSIYIIATLQRQIGAHRPPTRRERLGMSIALVGAILLVGEGLARLAGMLETASIRQALAGGMLGAAATALGALPLLWARPFSAAVQGRLLALAGGIMLSASLFSLLLPSFAAGRVLWGEGLATVATAGGLLAGLLAVRLLERALPPGTPDTVTAGPAPRSRGQIWLFAAAVTLHNIPEGLAVGVSAASTGGHALSLGIAAQDLPEGMAIALALLAAGQAPWIAVACGAASGLVEPLAALLGATAVATSAATLPFALALAAGAMLRVTLHDLLPEARRHAGGHPTMAALGAGFLVMLLLDTQL